MKKLFNKKAMTGWVWVLIILGIVALGVLIYLLLKGNEGGASSGVLSNLGSGGSSSNIKPPALPN